MPVPSDPHTFADGAGNVASGVQVNQRFTPLYNALNPAVVGLDYQNVQNNGLRETNMATGANGLAKGAFSVYRAAALSVTSLAVIVFDTEIFDVSGWHDVTTGRYTPQIAGYYRLSWSVEGTVIAADSFWQAILYKNGTIHKGGSRDFQRGSAAGPQSVGSSLVVANGSTDFFDVRAFFPGGTIPLTVALESTYFNGEMVGRS